MSQLSYESRLTITRGSTVNSPSSDTMEVPPGRLKLLRIIVPPGPRGEIEVWLNHQTHQLLPVPPGTYNNLDDDVIVEPVDYEIPTNTNTLTLYGTGEYCNFDHTVSWSVVVDTPETQAELQTAGGLVSRLAGIFGGS